MKPAWFLPVVLIIIIFFGIIFIPTARAYPVGSSGPPLPQISTSGWNSFQNLFDPYKSFFESLQSSFGAPVIGNQYNMPSVPVVSSVPSITFGNIFQNIAQEIDTWFYNLSGIRISTTFMAIVGGIIWIRGPIQEAFKWLSGPLR